MNANPSSPPTGRPPTVEEVGGGTPTNPNRDAVISERAIRNPYQTADEALSKDPNAPLSSADLRARGFDGDALDSLLRSRWVEGAQVGHRDGFRDASARWPEIFDEGHRAAAGVFFERGRETVAGVTIPALQRASSRIAEIESRTGSKAIKELCDAAVQEIQAALEQL